MGNRIAKPSVLNLHDHITVIEIQPSVFSENESEIKKTSERVLKFIGKKQTGEKANFLMEKTK